MTLTKTDIIGYIQNDPVLLGYVQEFNPNVDHASSKISDFALTFFECIYSEWCPFLEQVSLSYDHAYFLNISDLKRQRALQTLFKYSPHHICGFNKEKTKKKINKWQLLRKIIHRIFEKHLQIQIQEPDKWTSISWKKHFHPQIQADVWNKDEKSIATRIFSNRGYYPNISLTKGWQITYVWDRYEPPAVLKRPAFNVRVPKPIFTYDAMDDRTANLAGLLEQPIHSDIAFLVEGKTFHAHKLFLTSQLRAQKNPVIEIPHCRAAIFEILLQYLYTAQFPKNLSKKDCVELFLLCDRYIISLHTLKEFCKTQLGPSSIITISFKEENLEEMSNWCKLYIPKLVQKLVPSSPSLFGKEYDLHSLSMQSRSYRIDFYHPKHSLSLDLELKTVTLALRELPKIDLPKTAFNGTNRVRKLDLLLKSGSLSDITIEFKGRKFLLHKALLSISPFFKTLFANWEKNATEYTLQGNGFGIKEFNHFVHYLYTGEYPNNLTHSEWLSLHVLADYFCLDSLKAFFKNKLFETASPLMISYMEEEKYDLIPLHDADLKKLYSWSLSTFLKEYAEGLDPFYCIQAYLLGRYLKDSSAMQLSLKILAKNLNLPGSFTKICQKAIASNCTQIKDCINITVRSKKPELYKQLRTNPFFKEQAEAYARLCDS